MLVHEGEGPAFDFFCSLRCVIPFILESGIYVYLGFTTINNWLQVQLFDNLVTMLVVEQCFQCASTSLPNRPPSNDDTLVTMDSGPYQLQEPWEFHRCNGSLTGNTFGR